LLWDGRFRVEIAPAFEGRIEVRALARAGFAELKRQGRVIKASSALLLTPAFWRADVLLAVPPVAFWTQQGLEAMISAHFKGLRYNFAPGATRGRECDGPGQSRQ
jgi:hypothetical protein